jgi:hypothetical protein
LELQKLNDQSGDKNPNRREKEKSSGRKPVDSATAHGTRVKQSNLRTKARRAPRISKGEQLAQAGIRLWRRDHSKISEAFAREMSAFVLLRHLGWEKKPKEHSLCLDLQASIAELLTGDPKIEIAAIDRKQVVGLILAQKAVLDEKSVGRALSKLGRRFVAAEQQITGKKPKGKKPVSSDEAEADHSPDEEPSDGEPKGDKATGGSNPTPEPTTPLAGNPVLAELAGRVSS